MCVIKQRSEVKQQQEIMQVSQTEASKTVFFHISPPTGTEWGCHCFNGGDLSSALFLMWNMKLLSRQPAVTVVTGHIVE